MNLLRADWGEATEEGMASLRAHAASDVDNPRFVEAMGDLSIRSDFTAPPTPTTLPAGADLT